MDDGKEMPETIKIYCHNKGLKIYFSVEKQILASFEGWGYTWVVHDGEGAENMFHVSEVTSGCKIPIEGGTIESAEKAAKIFLSQYSRETVSKTIDNQRLFVARHKFEERKIKPI